LLLITVQPLRRSSRSSHGDPRYFQATLANFPATACTVSFWFSGSGTAFFYGDLDTAAPMDATNTPFSVVIDAGVEVRFLVTAGSVHAALPSVTGEHFVSVVFEQPAGSATGYVDPTGQRLSRSRDGGVPRRPRKDVPARAQIPVELRLDGIEELGNIPAVSRIPGAVFPFSGL
jgi:hypothetical protein